MSGSYYHYYYDHLTYYQHDHLTCIMYVYTNSMGVGQGCVGGLQWEVVKEEGEKVGGRNMQLPVQQG